MGVTAGLWIVPAEEFATRTGDAVQPRLPKGGMWFDLDKAWSAFDDVFQKMPPPLDRIISGDIWPEGRLDEDNGRDDATWLGFVSPATVSEIARLLDQMEPGEMVEMIRRAGYPKAQDNRGREMFIDFFEELRQAYRAAAQDGAGLGVLLC